jgi:hypothetical protein
MRRAALIFPLVFVLTFSPNRLQAQVVKGSWTKLETQPAGERLVVSLRNGSRIVCTLRGTTNDELLVAVHSTDETRIAKSNVADVTTEAKQRDSLKNGAAWGLGLGIGFGVLNGHLRGTREFVTGPRGLPLFKPPYGRITAINLNTGDHVWTKPNGDGPSDHPAIKHLNLPPLGQPGRASPLLTKTLLFVGRRSHQCPDTARWRRASNTLWSRLDLSTMPPNS